MSKPGITKKLKLEVYKKTGGHCYYCGIKLNHPARNGSGPNNENDGYEMFGIDHLIPNRDNSIDNLVPSCKMCNSTKRDGTIEDMRLNFAWRPLGIKFSSEQREFLKSHGLKLPTPEKHFKFWFEVNNK